VVMLVLCAVAGAVRAQASVSVLAEDACGSSRLSADDFTANAIVLGADVESCEIRWSSPSAPVDDKSTVELYYGQPGEVAALEREPITFQPDGSGAFVAVRRFSREEL